jgi:hypothetical protein
MTSIKASVLSKRLATKPDILLSNDDVNNAPFTNTNKTTATTEQKIKKDLKEANAELKKISSTNATVTIRRNAIQRKLNEERNLSRLRR